MIQSKFIEKENGTYYIKICRGCRTYEDDMRSLSEDQKKHYLYLCNVSIPFKEEEICPCSTCIVKMVCNRKCKELNDHTYK